MNPGARTQTLAYPSPQFPGPPAVAVDIPGEWSRVRATLFAGARRGQVVDFLQVTGSVGGPEAETDHPGIQQVMQSVRVQR